MSDGNSFKSRTPRACGSEHPKARRCVTGRFSEPIYLDLFEEAVFQGARAASPERLDHISEIVARGITQGDAARVDRKYLLRLLSELSDGEIPVLCLHGRYPGAEHDEFYERHRSVIQPPMLTFEETDREERAQGAVRANYEVHLRQMGLVQRYYPFLGRTPEFESDGTIKGGYLEISSLGAALLRESAKQREKKNRPPAKLGQIGPRGTLLSPRSAPRTPPTTRLSVSTQDLRSWGTTYRGPAR